MPMIKQATRSAVFLDRDGVINRNVYYTDSGEWESPRTVADVALHEGVEQAIASLNQAGLPVFIISNQPSYAKGKTTLAALHAVDSEIIRLLEKGGATINERFYAYHHPDFPNCDAPGDLMHRKPSPYFLKQAASRYDLDLGACWMVGDRGSDIECGKNGGTQTIAILPDHPGAKTGSIQPDYRATSLSDAILYIL